MAPANAPAQLLADGIYLRLRLELLPMAASDRSSGQPLRTIIMDSPSGYIAQARAMPNTANPSANPALAHILAVDHDVTLSATRMATLLDASVHPASEHFGNSSFASALKHTAHLISAGAVVPIYKITLDGFDTHAGQRARQDRLLGDLAQGLAALRSALQRTSSWNRTLVMTWRIRPDGWRRMAVPAPTMALRQRISCSAARSRAVTSVRAPACARSMTEISSSTTDFRSLYTTCVAEWWGYQGDFLTSGNISGLRAIKTAAH